MRKTTIPHSGIKLGLLPIRLSYDHPFLIEVRISVVSLYQTPCFSRVKGRCVKSSEPEAEGFVLYNIYENNENL